MKDMLGRDEVLTFEDAKKLLLKSTAFKFLPEIETEIESSRNRVLSQDIISPENLPNFTRSTMDGYAVNPSDTYGASEEIPAYLNVKGEVFMGKAPDFTVGNILVLTAVDANNITKQMRVKVVAINTQATTASGIAFKVEILSADPGITVTDIDWHAELEEDK